MAENTCSALRYYGGLYATIGGVLRDLNGNLNKSYLDGLEAEIKTAQTLTKNIFADADKDGAKRVLLRFAGKHWPQLFRLGEHDAEIWVQSIMAQTDKPIFEIKKLVKRYADLLTMMNIITKEIAYHLDCSLPIDPDGLEQFFTPAFIKSGRWPETLDAFLRFRGKNPSRIETAVLFRELNDMNKDCWIKQFNFQGGLKKFYAAIGVEIPKSVPRDTDCLDWMDSNTEKKSVMLDPFNKVL